MKRSIFYLICAVAVGGAACKKVPEATDPSMEAKPTATPEATATPPPVGERIDPLRAPPHPSKENQPVKPEGPFYPGVSPNPAPGGEKAPLPPHRKPPVAAKMEV